MTILPNRSWEGLPPISKVMYKDTYFMEGEDYSSWVNRITHAYASNAAHQERLATYIHNYWFHPSTPISSNGGTDRGLPISCFVREVADSKEGIFYAYNEAFWLGARGTGIGTTWDSVREVGATVSNIGKSSGIIPFIGISDRATLAISQGGLRRASEAVYISVEHPEILEFIDMRKPDRDFNRACPNIDHGVLITDAFMETMLARKPWDLVSRKTGKVVQTVDAYDLWCKILDVRVRLKGEPYIIFIDRMNDQSAPEYKALNKKIKLSNLCCEIALNTEEDKSNICCLASLNLEYYNEYADILPQVVADCTDFLDNVVSSFIEMTTDLPGFERALKGAIEERALGLGVMGFHGYLQKLHIPFESALAVGINKRIFEAIRVASDNHQDKICSADPTLRCPMSIAANTNRRNIVTIAIAPTMSISNLCDLASSGIEPLLTNSFSKKLKQGTFPIRNRYLQQLLQVKASELHPDSPTSATSWINAQWDSIRKAEGSVQHLECLSDWDKDVFKTAHELDQQWLIQHAADRQPYIDQAQSLNLFFPANSNVRYIYDVHVAAWRKGLKSLYYLRSSAESRATSQINDRKKINVKDTECLACQ